MKEAEIIDRAIANFEMITGATIKTKISETRNEPGDGFLELKFEDQQQDFALNLVSFASNAEEMAKTLNKERN
jgi:hypothetical protein